MPQKFSKEVIECIEELARTGHNLHQIVEQTGCSLSTASKYVEAWRSRERAAKGATG